MSTPAVIEKIASALALAQNAGTPGEAQAALLAAQRLMVRHGIDQSTVAAYQEQSAVQPLDIEAESAARLAEWKLRLADLIADNFRCKMYYFRGEGIHLLGMPADVSVAVIVYRIAVATLTRQVGAYMRSPAARPIFWTFMDTAQRRKRRIAQRADWINGFIHGLAAQFSAQVEREKWGLVIATPAPVTEALAQLGTQEGGGSKAEYGTDYQAHAAGFRAGQTFDAAPHSKIAEAVT